MVQALDGRGVPRLELGDARIESGALRPDGPGPGRVGRGVRRASGGRRWGVVQGQVVAESRAGPAAARAVPVSGPGPSGSRPPPASSPAGYPLCTKCGAEQYKLGAAGVCPLRRDAAGQGPVRGVVMRLPCGICDVDHDDVQAFALAHPQEAVKIRERMAFARSVWPDAEAEETAAVVAFLGRLENAGFEVRHQHR